MQRMALSDGDWLRSMPACLGSAVMVSEDGVRVLGRGCLYEWVGVGFAKDPYSDLQII